MTYETIEIAQQLSENVVRLGTLYPWVTDKNGQCWVEWELLYPGSGIRSGGYVEVTA